MSAACFATIGTSTKIENSAFLRMRESRDLHEKISRCYEITQIRVISYLYGGVQMSLNRVMMIGNLGQDPEIRYTPSGLPLVNFSVATDESYPDKEGKRQERLVWHRSVAVEAQSHGPHTRWLRFAGWIAPPPRKTRFRMVGHPFRAELYLLVPAEGFRLHHSYHPPSPSFPGAPQNWAQ